MSCHAPLRTPPTIVPLALFAGLAAACGGADDGGDPAAPDAGLDPAALWADLETCGLTGALRVSAAPAAGTCPEWPVAGEVVSVERDGDAVWLRAGTLELAFSAQPDSCRFVATGCTATLTTDEFGTEHQRYFAPELTLSADAAGVHLTSDGVDVLDARVGACAAGEFSLSPIAACDPLGTYLAAAPAGMTGACDLTWDAGEVSLAAGATAADGIVLSWAGAELGGLVLDPATCTVGGDKGVTDFWLYNGAQRSTAISLTLEGDTLSGTVTDALVGTTFDGKACDGASFALVAARPPRRDAARLEPSCAVAQPAACGNGVCEDGEGCSCLDCACTGGLSCAPDDVCRASCTVATEATDCPADQRCSPQGSPTVILPGVPTYCGAAGDLAAGAVCGSHDDCGRGLICHYSPSATVAMCQPPCGAGFASCTGDAVCQSAGDGSGVGSYPSAIAACEELAGPGEDCSAASCQDGAPCIQSCIDGVCEEYCSAYCGGGGCPPEVPYCKPVGSTSVCVKEP